MVRGSDWDRTLWSLLEHRFILTAQERDKHVEPLVLADCLLVLDMFTHMFQIYKVHIECENLNRWKIYELWQIGKHSTENSQKSFLLAKLCDQLQKFLDLSMI